MWCSLNSATGDHRRADVGPDANITGRRPSPSIRCADTTLFVIGCGLSTANKDYDADDDDDDADGAADSAGHLWRPRVSGGCGASVEQSATTDHRCCLFGGR